MDEMQDSTLATLTQMGTAQKRNYSKLPKIKYFRVQSRGAVGTMDARHERKTGAWAVLVDCGDRRGLRLVSDIAYENGMIVKGEFQTKQKAYDAAMDYKAKWGKETSKSGQKREEEKQKAIDAATQDAMSKVANALKTLGMSDEAVAAIIANAK